MVHTQHPRRAVCGLVLNLLSQVGACLLNRQPYGYRIPFESATPDCTSIGSKLQWRITNTAGYNSYDITKRIKAQIRFLVLSFSTGRGTMSPVCGVTRP